MLFVKRSNAFISKFLIHIGKKFHSKFYSGAGKFGNWKVVEVFRIPGRRDNREERGFTRFPYRGEKKREKQTSEMEPYGPPHVKPPTEIPLPLRERRPNHNPLCILYTLESWVFDIPLRPWSGARRAFWFGIATSGKTLFPKVDFAHLTHLRFHFGLPRYHLQGTWVQL